MEDILKLAQAVYQKTLGYELETLKINEDGSTTHLHSDKFLNEHPERKNSPEFSEEEEKKQVRLVATWAKYLRENLDSQ